jgi:hypothetical protein
MHVYSSDDVTRATHVLARNEHALRAFSNKKIFFQFKIEKAHHELMNYKKKCERTQVSLDACLVFFFFSKSLFGSVVAGAFQITFRAKMHANDIFSFF